MPDKEEYKAKQSAHAERMRVERALMDTLGVTRSQARDALGLFAQRQLAARVVAPVAPPQAAPALPVLTQVGERFEPRPFVLGDVGGVRAPRTGLSESGTANNPYVMGTNRTTSLDLTADDEWDATNPPSGYDGVQYELGWRYYPITTSTESYFFDDNSGNPHHWLMFPYQTFYRQVKFDSAKILVHVSVEYYGPIISYATFDGT